jgi:O-6-methylguanine DNA methyltransferase
LGVDPIAARRHFPKRFGMSFLKYVESYFSGQSMTFDCAVTANGTTFQQQVWTALQKIQPGETTTYTLLARLVGFPRAVRAVAAANAISRCAVIVPCRRVIGSNGDLTGYAGGLQRKRWLLQHERSHAAQHEKMKRRAS